MRFHDRSDAGQQLVMHLSRYAGRPDVIVLALPRGGVPVAFEVANGLGVAMDVWIVRKLGVPGHEELAMGAIASGGICVLNEDVVSSLPHAEKTLESVTSRELAELERREATYRGSRPPVVLSGKTVILVDDGLATGATMRAAIKSLRQHSIARCVVAVPVAHPKVCLDFRELVDEIVCLSTPAEFSAVGQFYRDFSQTTDRDVRELLARTAGDLGSRPPTAGPLE